MSQTVDRVNVDSIAEGQVFRAQLEHCNTTGDYIKIGNRVLLVIATVIEEPQEFHQFEYIHEDDVRHPHPEQNYLYAGEEEE